MGDPAPTYEGVAPPTRGVAPVRAASRRRAASRVGEAGAARRRRRPAVVGLSLALLLGLGSARAVATPSFALYVSTGGVKELAVGQTLALRALHPPPSCLPSPYQGKRRSAVPGAEMPIVWSVEPAGVATITPQGVLTALRPGMAVVRVQCREPNSPACAMTEPGTASLAVSREVPGGRLPRLDGGPAIESLYLAWDATPFQSLHRLDVALSGAGFAWAAGITTPTVPETGFPWVLEAAAKDRSFDDDEGYDPSGQERHRKDVTEARVTFVAWQDGVLSGRLRFETARGFHVDAAFQTRLEDRDGLLGKAAARR